MLLNVLPLFLANVLGVRVWAVGVVEGLAETTASLLKLYSGWLSDRRAETRTTDPFLRGGELIDFQGRVTSVEAAPADYGRTNWVVTLTTSDGGTAVLTYADGWGGESEPPFTHFGEAASGRLYPPGYRPFALADWISGRTVTAVTYADDHAARRAPWPKAAPSPPQPGGGTAARRRRRSGA